MEKKVNCALDCLNGCILGDKCPNQAHAATAAKFIAETSLEKILEMAETARLKKLTQPTQWIIPDDF